MELSKTRVRFFLLLVLWVANSALAQERVTPNSYKEKIRRMPAFSVYGVNYFITGTSPGKHPNSNNSDAKFQLGFRQRLSNLILPGNFFLFFTYRQKAFWDIYQDSFPFRETNYNPALGIARLFFKGQAIKSGLWIQFEHESNGRAEDLSRSWNFISLRYALPYQDRWLFEAKGWLPVGSLEENPGITDYRGYYHVSATWRPLKKLILEGTFNKAFTADWRGSMQLGISYKLSKHSNQYLYCQYFLGYAEDLVNYTELSNKLRIGITFKDLFVTLKE